jgi:hypothetical protein
VGTKVYFGPYSRNDVGVLDTTTDVFSTIALTGQTAGGAVHVAPIKTQGLERKPGASSYTRKHLSLPYPDPCSYRLWCQQSAPDEAHFNV